MMRMTFPANKNVSLETTFSEVIILVDENFIGPYKDKAMVST